ncbi:hypothetical protein C900_00250 [Fulvivirga imtechensis AK7]|uniref:GLPGLI family protein n=1 Tax=Fulvivirga imtechensis AK7 TaxID=1237149 RepID=L8JME2_9BACT|nr:GLPGLI family protein [Fulvivirga imtechensis]ELR68562.1 hypothetical protein C900_00250 [Fulvivirga imtechensis AK7]
MNKHLLFLTIVTLAVSTFSYSQSGADQSSGVITYESKMNLHRRLTGEQEGMKAMVPEFRITNFRLAFNGLTSLYKPILEDEEEEMGSGGMRIQMRQPYSENYTDAGNHTTTRMVEFMGKEYLIEDSLTIQPWKLGDEVREINGYNCRMAYYTDTTNNNTLEITAWYTMELPPFIGPERFNTLPGTVLAVDFNNGERVILARDIVFRELRKNEIKKPEKGTKVTEEEYRKLVEEQIERMRHGGGRMMIRN